MMLNLKARPCKLGTAINTRRELHGEEPVPAMDIPLLGIMISARELNALVDDPMFSDLVFDQRQNSDSPPEPQWSRKFKPLAMLGKFKDCTVTLSIGLKPETVTIVAAKIAKIRLMPLVGGQTELSLTVQATTEAKVGAKLLDFIDQEASVEIDIGERDDSEAVKDQPELNLQVADEKKADARKGKRSAAH